MRSLRGRVIIAAAVAGAALTAAVTMAQQPSRPAPRPPASPHAVHRTPEGWTFALPAGDPARGREAFRRFECHACHEVKGERFPAPTERGKAGPELAQMAPLHEAPYFAESIIHPSRLIEKGKGYEAQDGSSKMPSYNDSMTVQELIDLVAFLKSLKPPAGGPAHRGH